MTIIVSPPQHVLELTTLGHLDLSASDGIDISSVLVQGKRMALLTYLALARPRGFHRRDTLVGLFWPERDQRHARAALRQALHFLRNSLGPAVVLNRGAEEVGVDFSTISCDAVLFEEYLDQGDIERAVDMYGGPLLNGFFVNDAPEFERWLGVERDRLAQLYADGIRTLAEKTEVEADTASAVRWWKRLAIHDPYSSEIACRTILALEAAGDRAGAITHANAHVETVRTDLEVEPDSSMLELVERLREQPPPRTPARTPEPNRTAKSQATVTIAPPSQTEEFDKPSWVRLRNSVAAVLVLLLSGWALLVSQAKEAPRVAPTVSLAVLPFENLGSPQDDYFVVGLAEDIVCRLAGVQRLSLVGPNDGGLDAPDDGEVFSGASLAADYVLRGTFERAREPDGSRYVRLTPSLTRVADGAQIWTENIEGAAHRVFDGQVRIVENIVRSLGISLLSTERDWLRATPTSDPEAFDLFLLGNENLRKSANDALAARAAVDFYERATARDPNFVRAFAKLAIAHTSMFWWNHDHTAQRLAAARSAADTAVRLRPDMPCCHLALGWYYYWGERDYDRALRHFELARTNWPGVSDVLVLVAGIRRRQGDFECSLANHKEAATIDPSCATCLVGAGFTHLILREFETAEREALGALAIAPGFQYAQNVVAMARLSNGGDSAGAREMLGMPTDDAQVLRLFNGPWSALPRVFGGEYDSAVLSMNLDRDITDSAGYYLAKADVATRTDMHSAGTAYYDSARTILEHQVAALPEDPGLRSRLGLAYAGLDMRQEAVREGTEATRLRPVSEDAVDGPLATEMLARIYTMLGDADDAIDRLEILLSIPSHLSVESLRLDPLWAPLRHHERFLRLVN
jgi:serine/threonine-protein kinase